MSVMFNEIVHATKADDAWVEWFNKIKDNYNEESKQESRDGKVVGEIINAITIIDDPTRCIMTNEIRKMPLRYAIGELLWYESANNKLSAIQHYTKAWDRMSDDGETVNSNYGWCIKKKYNFDQWEYVKKCLSENKESRQAVIHIKEPYDAVEYKSKDMNCTICLQFFIRDEKLYMTTYMRSNDMWMGFPYDVFQFTAMQIKMAMELNVGIGTYTHVAGSLHFYERDYEVALKNLEVMNAK